MKKIEGTVEAWDSGLLGTEEKHVVKSDLDPLALDDALALKAISVRMPTSLVEDLKMIAQVRGLGYQPLMKQVLTRFVEAEKKLLLVEAAKHAAQLEDAEEAGGCIDAEYPAKKVACA